MILLLQNVKNRSELTQLPVYGHVNPDKTLPRVRSTLYCLFGRECLLPYFERCNPARIGAWLQRPAPERIRRVASTPSMPGIFTSISTRSKRPVAAAATAASPSQTASRCS